MFNDKSGSVPAETRQSHQRSDEAVAMAGPLQGLRVVELAGIGPGPHAAMVLGDLGADVVRIERVSNGVAPVPNPRDDHLLRNRRWVQANLKDSEGRDRVLRLISNADALIEGYRPGVTERLGLGPQDCARINKRLIYARMTGWGRAVRAVSRLVTTSTTFRSTGAARHRPRR